MVLPPHTQKRPCSTEETRFLRVVYRTTRAVTSKSRYARFARHRACGSVDNTQKTRFLLKKRKRKKKKAITPTERLRKARLQESKYAK